MAFIGDGAWQEGQTLVFNGSTAVDWTNIPTDAHMVRLVFANVSIGTTNIPHIAMRLGNGSLDTGNNYDWRLKDLDGTTQGNSGDSVIRITHTNHGSTNHRWHGIIDINFVTNEYTNISMQVWSRYTSNNNHLEYGGARWTTNTAIDRIRLFHTQGSNYNGGRGTVYYA